MPDPRTRNALLAALGGLLWTALPALDGPLPTVVLLAPLIPPLLGFGVLEVWSRYREAYGTAGRVGVALSALGLCFVFVPALLYATTDFGTQPLGALVLAIPAGVGVFSLWAGTVSLALALRNCGVVGTPLAVAFALALPASLLVNALMTPALGVGVGVYGLAWVAVATRLARPAEASADVTPRSRLDVSPHRLVAGIVGLVLVGVGAPGLLLWYDGIASTYIHTAGTTQFVVNVLHVVLGAGTLGAGAVSAHAARLSLRVVAVVCLGTVVAAVAPVWPPVAGLVLGVYLGLALVSGIVGFGVAGPVPERDPAGPGDDH